MSITTQRPSYHRVGPCSDATLLRSIGKYAHARNNLSALLTALGLSTWWLAVHLFDDPHASRPVRCRVRCRNAEALCGEECRHARCDRCLADRHLLVSARATTRSCGLNERTRHTCFTVQRRMRRAIGFIISVRTSGLRTRSTPVHSSRSRGATAATSRSGRGPHTWSETVEKADEEGSVKSFVRKLVKFGCGGWARTSDHRMNNSSQRDPRWKSVAKRPPIS
jgi:hypothetical protein